VTPTSPRKLTKQDDLTDFDCGSREITVLLRQYALPSQLGGMSTVFVTTVDDKVLGYYALTMGGVDHSLAPGQVTKGQPRYPIPVIILARLGVDISAQGQGLGRALVVDALRRAEMVSDQIGCRAFVIHAKDEAARECYLGLAEFEPSPTDELHLFLLMKDLRILLS